MIYVQRQFTVLKGSRAAGSVPRRRGRGTRPFYIPEGAQLADAVQRVGHAEPPAQSAPAGSDRCTRPTPSGGGPALSVAQLRLLLVPQQLGGAALALGTSAPNSGP